MPLKDLLPRVSRPSRYLGGELGIIRKDPRDVELTFALAFPDVYEVGMSHLGFAILYHILNEPGHIAAERVYAPWIDMEEALREAQEPLASIENERPLGAFDIVGFTLQYELSYTNLLTMLDLGGIPRRREERDAGHPLVVVGGPCAFNPEPLADFFDCAVIGDAEEAVLELCEAVRAAKSEGVSRTELLERLSRIEGIYVPAFFQPAYHDDGVLKSMDVLRPGYEKVRRRFLPDLDAAPYPSAPLVPTMNTVHNRVAAEVARGCTRGCRFCQAGYIYRPVRERSPQRLLDIIDESLAASGHEEVSLLSLSTGDYTCIEPLLKGLMQRYAESNVAVSLPSLRVGSLTPELMEEVKKVRKTGFTLAPEAGSERLRQVINKGISEEDLLEATHAAFTLGWRLVKLYFMIGLPTETDADIDGIVALAARVKRSGKGTQGGADVNVSVSTFVPKPHTPFQWEAQLGIEETLARQGYLRDELRRRKLRLKYHKAQMSFLEGVFARGDRRLGRVIERAADLGCRFDGWDERFDFAKWRQAFADSGLEPAWYLRARGEDEVLPWDHIDCGVPKEYFLRERRRARSGEPTPDCRHGACSACGVCDFEALRMRLVERGALPESVVATQPAPEPAADGERYKVRLRLAKTGKARFVGHLEFLTLFHRAVRRAGLPVRYSQGYHPHPRISFSEALPSGLESDAELIDIELSRAVPAREVVESLNSMLPEGFSVREGAAIDWRAPSPSASIEYTLYRVQLPPSAPADLAQRVDAFLAADAVPATRLRKGREVAADLRPDVVDLRLEEGALLVAVCRGNPFAVTARLLGCAEEQARDLAVRKLGVVLRGEE